MKKEKVKMKRLPKLLIALGIITLLGIGSLAAYRAVAGIYIWADDATSKAGTTQGKSINAYGYFLDQYGFSSGSAYVLSEGLSGGGGSNHPVSSINVTGAEIKKSYESEFEDYFVRTGKTSVSYKTDKSMYLYYYTGENWLDSDGNQYSGSQRKNSDKFIGWTTGSSQRTEIECDSIAMFNSEAGKWGFPSSYSNGTHSGSQGSGTVYCEFTRTVVYDANGADNASNFSDKGGKVTLNKIHTVTDEIPQKEGADFLYWSTPSGTAYPGSSVTVNCEGENFVLKAEWSDNSGSGGGDIPITPPPTTPPPTGTPDEDEETYTVSVSGSYGGSAYGGGTYKEGDTVSVSASPNYGYDFSYWNVSGVSVGWDYYYSSFSFTMPANNVSLTANFNEKSPNTVAYNSNDGKNTYKYQNTDSWDDYYATVLDYDDCGFSIPTGYRSFAGWHTSKTGTPTVKPGDSVYVSGTKYLYAIWGNPVTYIVQFAKHDIETKPVTLGEQQTWTYDAPSPMPAEPYTKAYTVSYNLNKTDSMSTTPNLKAALTNANTKATFTFTGWRPYRYVDGAYSDMGVSPIKPGVAQNLTSIQDDRIILFPVWGGDASYVTLPEVAINGYWFNGWALSATESMDTGTVYSVPEGSVTKYQPRSTCTMYANYTPKTYEVNLDRQDPDLNLIETVTMTFDAYGPDIPVPKRLHYTFYGYYTGANGTGTKYYDHNGKSTRTWTTYDGSITTLYAYWVKDTQIIFSPNGGVGYMDDQWVQGSGNTLTTPDFNLSKNLYTKYGYAFTGWNTKADGSGTGYADGASVSGLSASSVLTLYAQWGPDSVKVNLKADPGTVNPTSITVTYNSTYGTIPNPTPPAGYSFTHWEKEGTGMEVTSSTKVTDKEEHTLVANYKENTYTVTFDYNWKYERTAEGRNPNVDSSTLSVTFNSTYGTLPNPGRDGYTFLGWYTEESGGNGTGTQITSLTTVTTVGNHILYAKWQNNEYTLNFDYNLDYRVDPN